MREPLSRRRRLALFAGLAAVLLALTLARGLVVLAAAASIALVVCAVGAVLPLQRDDGVDWDWLPRRADEVPPEPGIGALRRLLAPNPKDTTAPAQLHELLRTLAEERHGGAAGRPDGPLARYLASPPRRLTLAEAEDVLADLETSRSPYPTKETA
ncbi:hypothetical protein [Phycicoccus sonneratiae]|uniref:Uncharacterized protein n=1 Tax=Phycicoccus sonneratiae TaxID=2807628 RepID=A0ABS2CGW8_9MICO|nr:hypothetical protein [Phycicoccus sonneraticus]MBM6399060.1 hypothetical protein [Phycicoccus sonneraticus]